MTHTPESRAALGSGLALGRVLPASRIPDVLPADSDPIWQLARAERELARIHASEQARWLRRCALVRASRAEWGGVTAIAAEPPRADLRARFVADLDAWRRERGVPALDEVAPELGVCARRPVGEWPDARALAAAAQRRDPGVRSAFVRALVALAGGDVNEARERAVALLERMSDGELRARSFALLGLACMAERDARGAWLHLSTAQARSAHAGVRAAFELAAALVDAPLPARCDLVARARSGRGSAEAPGAGHAFERPSRRADARCAAERAHLRARLTEFAARACAFTALRNGVRPEQRADARRWTEGGAP